MRSAANPCSAGPCTVVEPLFSLHAHDNGQFPSGTDSFLCTLRLGERLPSLTDFCDRSILAYQARIRHQPRRLTPHMEETRRGVP